ncbi:MAG: ribose-phosphate diphosphokinase [Holosporales bacterium]|jgi:ribose-phosphate pyrophosphokinase|nr:ribose-phosphate diphosphokinase [Holosporales bacterium]
MRLLCDSSTAFLGESVARISGVRLLARVLCSFPNGELYACLQDSAQGEDVFVLASTPTASDWIGLFLLLDALVRDRPRRIILCLAYCGYGRQDRQTEPSGCFSLARFAALLGTFPIEKIFVIDPHNHDSLSLFPVPCFDLSSHPVFCEFIKNNTCCPDLFVAPDYGASHRTQRLAEACGRPWTTLDKRQPAESLTIALQERVRGKHCALVDDILDSGWTLWHAASVLMRAGALRVEAFVTHGLPSTRKVPMEECVKQVVVTDTLFSSESRPCVRSVTVAPVVEDLLRELG